ncbi:WD40-repeat-containing domain protein [Phakopsora pachyrhizi]|uniref:WD40-repeat-containing domain protein n=1 Tax=Phakopsora pachyrhizi TaxID=170000 RepID=A0AAV0B7N8_PHAPC|nr:WD40-repeat-containing domain protein [Phakopsora pachyrhizi]
MTLKTPTARVLAGHSGPVFTLGWSVDGRRLASGSKDEGIRIWNPERADYGKASAELKGHTSRINQLRWDPTHPERLASAGEDGTLRFWDIRLLRLCERKKLGEHVEYSKSLNASEGQKDQINEVAFSHSVVTYEFKLEDGAVRLNQFNRCEAHACIINCIDIDPRGRYIAVGGADSIVSLIDLEDFYCVNTFAHLDSDVRTISFSYDGDFVAIAGKDFFIDISSVSTGQQVKKIDSLTYPVNTLAWHPSKYFLAYAGDEKAGNVRVVNLIE